MSSLSHLAARDMEKSCPGAGKMLLRVRSNLQTTNMYTVSLQHQVSSEKGRSRSCWPPNFVYVQEKPTLAATWNRLSRKARAEDGIISPETTLCVDLGGGPPNEAVRRPRYPTLPPPAPLHPQGAIPNAITLGERA